MGELIPIPFAGYMDIEEMNNEPVAWMNKEANVFAQHEEGAKNFGCTIPLYTHPADITDEEKWKLWGECPHGLVYDRVMMFADLILKKASEK